MKRRESIETHHAKEHEITHALQPLLAAVRELDCIRSMLEEHGGRHAHLEQITRLLRKPIALSFAGRDGRGCLAARQELTNLLNTIFRGSVHMDVRNARTAFIPMYYICRTAFSAGISPSPVLEDIYMSPSFPFEDDRYFHDGVLGGRHAHLRMSPFRESVRNIVGTSEADVIDDALLDVATWFFSAAFDESQWPALILSRCIGPPLQELRPALEVIHLAATAEPSVLRQSTNETVRRFFTQAYPQAYIVQFLDMLATMNGKELMRINSRAATLYSTLEKEYAQLLMTRVRWGLDSQRPSLWQALYANMNRIEYLQDALRHDDHVRSWANLLNTKAARLVRSLLSM
jgi:hypothetical protein